MEQTQPRKRLHEEDPRGRIDVACFKTAEAVVKGSFGEAGARIWDGGLGDVVEELVRSNVPDRVITPVDIMRELGITRAPGNADTLCGGIVRGNGRRKKR